MSEPRYEDPTVAYNTGYNDGQREERDLVVKALRDLEVEVLNANHGSVPRAMGALRELTRKIERGLPR